MQKTTHSIFILIAALVFQACSQDQSTPATDTSRHTANYLAPSSAIADVSEIIPTGWQETLISVSDVEEWKTFYVEVLGWEVRSEAAVSKELLSAWNLPTEATAASVVVANPRSDRGFVRIVNFAGVPQGRIRQHAQAWETGGIYNMNVRVADVHAIEPQVTNAGWQAPSAPVNFIFGPFDVWEWIPRHKDDVRIAFAQRVSPPLEGWPNLRVTSRAFNSTQIVRNMGEAINFYQGVLGFKASLEHQGASARTADHVLGLSHQAMTSVIRDVRILSPTGVNDGSVELLYFHNYSGRDFSDRAVPPNLGNLMLRYAVPDLRKLAAHLTASGVDLEYPATETEIQPYGLVKILAVRAPDGAWLEFFEILNKD